MIFLAISPPNGQEVHVKWNHHTALSDANAEISMVRGLMIKQNKKPYDCYVYEAETPPYGLRGYELDEVDMNFYETKTEDEIKMEKKSLDSLIYKVGKLAADEQAKFG